ncbi:hypothetical protein GBA65_15460 [Rubrobacter marinus]|uniref:Uncharacterized protein n=1 Tax=Rubrobacter marinus TaxID=2653852 RepID=A0A6G8PZN3_9ACTN|nr:hypothetical protein [Rubrobacter marinus]QIN79694.1 hypothetical protein GBA65_15460 [Rubrobacter marinus]
MTQKCVKLLKGAEDMGAYRKILLDNDETNQALGVAGREARVRVPGYGGPMKAGAVQIRPLAPGYGVVGKHEARGRVEVPGYGKAPVSGKILRLPNS